MALLCFVLFLGALTFSEDGRPNLTCIRSSRLGLQEFTSVCVLLLTCMAEHRRTRRY